MVLYRVMIYQDRKEAALGNTESEQIFTDCDFCPGKINAYYDSMSLLAFLMNPRYRIFHFGYWDRRTILSLNPFNRSLIRSNELLADGLKLEKGMRILDAGCGWGGTAIWLAENFGISVEGITLLLLSCRKFF